MIFVSNLGLLTSDSHSKRTIAKSTCSQSSYFIFQLRPSPSNPPQRLLPPRRPLPTHHQTSNPPPLFTALYQTPHKPTNNTDLDPPPNNRIHRPLLDRRIHILHQRPRHLPLALLLLLPKILLGPHLPRRPRAPAPAQIPALL